jgi:predicted small integral membrane protein
MAPASPWNSFKPTVDPRFSAVKREAKREDRLFGSVSRVFHHAPATPDRIGETASLVTLAES